MRSLSHLREDARWCVFREVAANTIPGDKTIVVFECECRIAIRLIESEIRSAEPAEAVPRGITSTEPAPVGPATPD